MFDETGRRRFLELAGTGTAFSLAGCSDLRSHGGEGAGSSEEGPATVTVAVQPDQAALQQRRAEIRSKLQSGNMTRTEAQQAFQQAQTELRKEAMSAFRQRVKETSTLAIEDSVSELGAFLVTGSAAALIGTLSAKEVSAILPEAAFERARSQSGGSSGAQNAS